jgi:type II secretory pathway component PulJ
MKTKRTKKMNEGYIFVEVLISMIIISMLLMTFVAMFVVAAKNNSRSRDIMDATYTAQDLMEQIYDLSMSQTLGKTVENLKDTILTDSYYESLADEQVILGKYENSDIAITIKDTEDEKLSLVKVEVYSDDTYTQSQAVMQSNLLWKDDDIDDPEPMEGIVLYYVTVENRVYSENDKKMAYTLAFTFTENGETHMAYDLTTRHVNFNSMNFPIIQTGSIGVGYKTVDYEIKLTKIIKEGKPDLSIKVLSYKVKEQ